MNFIVSNVLLIYFTLFTITIKSMNTVIVNKISSLLFSPKMITLRELNRPKPYTWRVTCSQVFGTPESCFKQENNVLCSVRAISHTEWSNLEWRTVGTPATDYKLSKMYHIVQFQYRYVQFLYKYSSARRSKRHNRE
jgi:hypothetical protein